MSMVAKVAKKSIAQKAWVGAVDRNTTGNMGREPWPVGDTHLLSFHPSGVQKVLYHLWAMAMALGDNTNI